MKTSYKILLLVSIIVLIGLSFLTAGNRFFNDSVADKQAENKEKKISSDSADEIFTENPIYNEEEDVVDTEENAFLQVLPQDCDNGCKNYQQQEDVTYCKQVCGLVEVKKEAKGCDALEDLEKDYCLKDEAISKSDNKICDKIEDSKIKKTCKNRILEDIVDKQMQIQ